MSDFIKLLVAVVVLFLWLMALAFFSDAALRGAKLSCSVIEAPR